MITPPRRLDPEADDHLIEKRRISERRSTGAEVVARVKQQFQDSTRERAGYQNSTAILVGHGAGEQLAAIPFHTKEVDLHPRRGCAAAQVENVSGKLSHAISARSAQGTRTGAARPYRPPVSSPLPRSCPRSGYSLPDGFRRSMEFRTASSCRADR